MNVLLDNAALFREGLLGTLSLTAVSAALALVLGVVTAAFRVSPVPPLRTFAAVWVTLLRNTPLTLLFLIVVFIGPQIFFPGLSWYTLAVISLGCYTSAFVCEVVRSGINTVPLGQAEAARGVGMTFTQTLRLIILPQAGRAVIAPIGSLMIALTKNSAIAGAFGVYELFTQQKRLSELGYGILAVFVWIALAYLLITLAISGLFRVLENRLVVTR
ncbi:amino acid ABC transporter permease [Streptomyces sp. CA-135486]|uniref:amino acid ABC transporter permease n=1 Tax=Streptomyces sp. CA-135486 TaxID=3240049 RepID=UPI003D8C8CCC